MQRFIAVRVLQSLLAILVMSVIVFGLARISGNPLDVMLPIEALPEDYERLEKHWGLDKPLFPDQFVAYVGSTLRGDLETPSAPRARRSAPGGGRNPAAGRYACGPLVWPGRIHRGHPREARA